MRFSIGLAFYTALSSCSTGASTFHESRITNGAVATHEQFPYQVGILLQNSNASFWCGGTLISNQWILTAAHCTNDMTFALVYLGTFDRTNTREVGRRAIRVDRINVIVHEHWNPSSLVNDISLIKLPNPVTFNDYIRPAKLPKPSERLSNYSGQKAIASGWGLTSDSVESVITDKLRWIEVPIMTNTACSSYYGLSVQDTNICINTMGAKSICDGDSGGPLVLANERSTVIGVTSFGPQTGCEKGLPGVFTRVASYLDWIAKNSGVVGK